MVGTTIVHARDGRELAACQWGPENGSPVFVLHGTPGGRHVRHCLGEYERIGVSAVTYDRPGYGRSTRAAGRSVADSATDVALIADTFGIDSFAVMGTSGGGPHALAVAALLPDRVARSATVVGVGPANAEGLDFLDGLSEEDRPGVRRGMIEPEVYVPETAYPRMKILAESLPEDNSLPAAISLMLRDGVLEALAPGPGGMIDDYAMNTKAWGFDLSAISCPTTIMAATDDVWSCRHGEWLSGQVPNGRYVIVPGGHLGPRPLEEEQLLAWLVER